MSDTTIIYIDVWPSFSLLGSPQFTDTVSNHIGSWQTSINVAEANTPTQQHFTSQTPCCTARGNQSTAPFTPSQPHKQAWGRSTYRKDQGIKSFHCINSQNIYCNYGELQFSSGTQWIPSLLYSIPIKAKRIRSSGHAEYCLAFVLLQQRILLRSWMVLVPWPLGWLQFLPKAYVNIWCSDMYIHMLSY